MLGGMFIRPRLFKFRKNWNIFMKNLTSFIVNKMREISKIKFLLTRFLEWQCRIGIGLY